MVEDLPDEQVLARFEQEDGLVWKGGSNFASGKLSTWITSLILTLQGIKKSPSSYSGWINCIRLLSGVDV